MAHFFIRRPVFAWVIAIVIMLGGALAIATLSISQYPDIAPTTVRISATYNGASAETVEKSVTTIIEDGMTDVCEAVFYNDKVISVELPTTIVREIAYTEPSVRGDTSGKVMKTARLKNGAELQVSAFCEIGDSIEIDTRTGEYKSRVKA